MPTTATLSPVQDQSGRARKSRHFGMPQLADAMLCGYGSGLEEEPGTTFEAIPQSIVRDEVLKHADGTSLSAAAVTSKALSLIHI